MWNGEFKFFKIEFSKSKEQWKEFGPKFSSDEMGVIRVCVKKSRRFLQ